MRKALKKVDKDVRIFCLKVRKWSKTRPNGECSDAWEKRNDEPTFNSQLNRKTKRHFYKKYGEEEKRKLSSVFADGKKRMSKHTPKVDNSNIE